MRTVQQIHEAAQAIVSDGPKRSIHLLAGELADIIAATAKPLDALDSQHPARLIHQHYANSKNHHREMALVVGADRVFALTSLLQPVAAAKE